MNVPMWAWAAFAAVIVVMLLIDLLAHRGAHVIGFKEAAWWSALWVGLSLVFAVVVTLTLGVNSGVEFTTAWLLEKSLSVDNLFVFAIILSTFAVPEEHQHKVLIFGIALALAMRAVFIALGATLIALFSFMFLLFGVLLIWTAVQLFRHRNEDPDIEDNALVRATRRVFPVASEYDGGKLFTRIGDRRLITPLFIVLVAIGSTDLLFALDSIPAVFGVTEEPYIVFCANAFALLGLRALYFLVTGLLDRLVYLSTGLALILGLIGFKLILHWAHEDIDSSVPELETGTSLIVIAGILTAVTIASVLKVRRDPEARAHAGSLRATRSDPAAAADEGE